MPKASITDITDNELLTCSIQAVGCECRKGAEGSSSFFPKSALQQSGAVVISGHGNLQCATTIFQLTGWFKTRQYRYTKLATSVSHLSNTLV